MRRHFLVFSAVAMSLVMMLAGCATSNVPSDLNTPVPVDEAQAPAVAEVEAEDVVEGIFDINGLDVVSYRLRGEGPDGAYFDWIEVTEPRVAIADIRRGEWTLYAQGLNADGQPVIQGSLQTFLSEDSPVDNLVFKEDYGRGDVRCAFAWNPSQVQHPDVEIYMQKATGGEWIARDSSEIIIGDGTAMWTATGIDSGSYVIRILLKDRSSIVSGAAAALRVIDDKLSIGQVRLTVGDLSQIYGIMLDNVPADTVEGMLALSTGGVLYRSNMEDLIYDWFIDGEYLDGFSAKEIEIGGLERGYHRIDCIVRTDDYGSINSDTIHVFSDGESITEVPEEEVNAVIKDFKATLANEQELKGMTATANVQDVFEFNSEENGDAAEIQATVQETVDTTANTMDSTVPEATDGVIRMNQPAEESSAV